MAGIHQSMLETVIPKEPHAVVQVLVGSNKGQVSGLISAQSWHQHVAVIL